MVSYICVTIRIEIEMLQTSMVNVVRPCWVSKLEPYNGRWYLSENGKPCGDFDAIVIAHNGKYIGYLML